MPLQICSTTASADVVMACPASPTAAGGTWSPSSVARIAKRQLSSWLCMPAILSATTLSNDYANRPLSRKGSLGSAGRSVDIHSLPTELLDMVFYHYTHTFAATPHTDPDMEAIRMSSADPFRKCISVRPDANTNPVILTHVCSRWRALARLSPKLWSKISVRFPKSRDVPMFATWLQRSANRPLDLTIIQDSEDVNTRNTSTIRDIFFLILREAHRWRNITLRLYADTGPLFRSIFEHRYWPRPSILEGVYIHLLEDWSAEESLILCSWLFSSPKLHLLDMADIPALPNAIWDAPLHRMSSLELGHISLDQLLGILGACPVLQDLCVYAVSEPKTAPATPQRSQSLKSLNLVRIGLVHPELLFDHIIAPSLETVRLPTGLGPARDPNYAWSSLESFLRRSSSALHTLEIDVLGDQECHLAKLLESPCFRETRELIVLSKVTETTVASLTVKPNTTPLLPRLTKLRLRQYAGPDGSLSRMIVSRTGVLQRVRAILDISMVHDLSFSVPGMVLELEP